MPPFAMVPPSVVLAPYAAGLIQVDPEKPDDDAGPTMNAEVTEHPDPLFTVPVRRGA